MKKLNFMLGIALLFSMVLVSSSFTKTVNKNKNVAKVITLNNGVGNIITIDNGQTWYWIPDNCNAAWVPSTDARVQTSSNGFWNVTINFQLPSGHCDIPANGATVTHYNADSWAIVNSNGKVNAKIVVNPN
jgi:hypothetical protein